MLRTLYIHFLAKTRFQQNLRLLENRVWDTLAAKSNPQSKHQFLTQKAIRLIYFSFGLNKLITHVEKKKMFAYAGKILRVNLTTGKVSTEPLSEELAKNYIGGIGLGIRLLMDNSKPGTDPFSPDNPLIFATGPLSGTMGPTAGNGYAVVSKSPATGGVGEAKAHGFFGPDLKRAGYDAVIITGKADKLSYLWIDDDKVQLMNAEQMKGKSPYETDVAIRE